jgi:hypothetical protein
MAMNTITNRKRPSSELLASGGIGASLGPVLEPIAMAHGVPPGVTTAVVTLLAHWLQGRGRAQ